MTKYQFLAELEQRLSGLPREDVKERLAFFDEMIDDLIDEGLTEEQAVEKIGTVDDVVSQILEETPLTKLIKEKIKPKHKLEAWEIVLLVIGSPIWISLIAAALAVAMSMYVSVWAVIIFLWAVFASFVACAAGLAAVAPGLMIAGRVADGLLLIAAALVLAGLAIFAFFGCRAATKGILMLTKKIALAIKKPFCRKEKGK